MGYFDKLGDDLSEALSAPLAPAKALPANYESRDFIESCRKCGGTGRYRHFGPCFACKGAGKLTFKTSPEARAKSRASSQRRAEFRAAERARDAAAWANEHTAECAWIAAATGRGFEFARSMGEAVIKWGSLTEGQLAAVRKCMARDAERTAQRAAEKAAREAAAPVVDVSKIEGAFEHARSAAVSDGEGIKWLKLYLDTFTFLDAPARDQWPAAILVREGDAKLGRIVGGKFLRSFKCDDATEARVVAAAADPANAAKAYGLRTGSCSCCGRELTNAESRERGIGPICAEKYGW